MSPCSYFSLSSKRSEVICARNDKKRVFCDSDVLKNVVKFQIFFCPENKNFVCSGLLLCDELLWNEVCLYYSRSESKAKSTVYTQRSGVLESRCLRSVSACYASTLH